MNRRHIAAGLHRGVMELRHIRRDRRAQVGLLVNPLMFLLVASGREGDIPGSHVPAANQVIGGGIASVVFLAAMTWLPQQLANDREDGTLLRLRGTPGGIPAYLLSKVVALTGTALITVAVLLTSGTLLTDATLPTDISRWMTLLWVLFLGLAALVPLGAALGAVLPSSREAVALLSLPVFGLIFISGVFYPMNQMPRWLQTAGEVFPLAWMAKGVRSAFLPDSALTAETGHSWQHLQTAGALTAWLLAALLVAPSLLRRAARQQSGSRLSARREFATHRS